jgi:hypothetical protein
MLVRERSVPKLNAEILVLLKRKLSVGSLQALDADCLASPQGRRQREGERNIERDRERETGYRGGYGT